MRFEGKLTERWGRKASGLRDLSAYDSGVAGANLKPSATRTLRAGARLFVAAYPKRRLHCRPTALRASVPSDIWTMHCINR